MKSLIVGVDPGTYVGIAVFDVNMRLVSSSTITNAGKEGAVHEISKHGTPIVMACDVAQPPEFVIQIASYYNARLAHPKNDMHEKDKTEMAAKYKPGTVHERDAIAAVVSFFNESGNKIRWIEKALRDKGLSNIEEDVKRFAFSGMRVDDAIKALVPSDKEYAEVLAYAATLPEAPKTATGKPERRAEDRDTILGLLESNIRMRSRLTLLEEENKALQRRIGEFKQGTGMDKEMRSLLQSRDMQIRRLQALLDRREEELAAARKKAGASAPSGGSSGVVVSTDKTKTTIGGGRETNSSDSSEEASQEDLKGGEEDSGLRSIVEEYRQSRAREGKRF